MVVFLAILVLSIIYILSIRSRMYADYGKFISKDEVIDLVVEALRPLFILSLILLFFYFKVGFLITLIVAIAQAGVLALVYKLTDTPFIPSADGANSHRFLHYKYMGVLTITIRVKKYIAMDDLTYIRKKIILVMFIPLISLIFLGHHIGLFMSDYKLEGFNLYYYIATYALILTFFLTWIRSISKRISVLMDNKGNVKRHNELEVLEFTNLIRMVVLGLLIEFIYLGSKKLTGYDGLFGLENAGSIITTIGLVSLAISYSLNRYTYLYSTVKSEY